MSRILRLKPRRKMKIKCPICNKMVYHEDGIIFIHFMLVKKMECKHLSAYCEIKAIDEREISFNATFFLPQLQMTSNQDKFKELLRECQPNFAIKIEEEVKNAIFYFFFRSNEFEQDEFRKMELMKNKISTRVRER